MHTLDRSHIPADYVYYRTSSDLWYQYYKNHTRVFVARLGDGSEFLRGYRIGIFWQIEVEKIDTEVTLEMLRELGIHHGVIIWTPKSRIEKPDTYHKIPEFFAERQLHSSRSAFAILENEYWKKWSDTARNERQRCRKLIESDILTIRTSTPSEFLRIYSHANIRDPHQQLVANLTKKLFSDEHYSRENSLARTYLIEENHEIVGGGIFIDMPTTSQYWASFFLDTDKRYPLGVALIDRWFADSLALGIKYCDLDHMRNHFEPKNQSGYTQFKSKFADYDVFFSDTWIRFF